MKHAHLVDGWELASCVQWSVKKYQYTKSGCLRGFRTLAWARTSGGVLHM